jgi:hypothetical protein
MNYVGHETKAAVTLRRTLAVIRKLFPNAATLEVHVSGPMLQCLDVFVGSKITVLCLQRAYVSSALETIKPLIATLDALVITGSLPLFPLPLKAGSQLRISRCDAAELPAGLWGAATTLTIDGAPQLQSIVATGLECLNLWGCSSAERVATDAAKVHINGARALKTLELSGPVHDLDVNYCDELSQIVWGRRPAPHADVNLSHVPALLDLRSLPLVPFGDLCAPAACALPRGLCVHPPRLEHNMSSYDSEFESWCARLGVEIGPRPTWEARKAAVDCCVARMTRRWWVWTDAMPAFALVMTHGNTRRLAKELVIHIFSFLAVV